MQLDNDLMTLWLNAVASPARDDIRDLCNMVQETRDLCAGTIDRIETVEALETTIEAQAVEIANQAAQIEAHAKVWELFNVV